MKQVFSIIPGSQAPFLIMGGVSLLLIGLIGLLFYIAGSSKNTKFEITQTSLRITGNIYGRAIPLKELRMDELKMIDMDREGGYSLGWVGSNTRMPGYKAGWFRLGNGTKALVFITSPKVVYIPTDNGYSLMMSVSQPEQFLNSLHQASNWN